MADAPLELPDSIAKLDDLIDELWENFRGIAVVDRVFYAASAAGDFSAVWHGINLVRTISHPNGRARFIRLAAGIAVESLVVNQGVKRLFARERPVEERERPHHLRQPSTSSFPSGHASAAAFAVTLLNENRGRRWPIRAVGAVVATSRLHVRIHHGSDVVAGALVGRLLARGWQRAWPLRSSR